MAQFINPFPFLSPDRKLTDKEAESAIRQSLAAELEAVHFYEAVAEASDNPLVQDVMKSIADEERVHAGEFHRLLSKLVPDEEEKYEEGYKEVDDMEKEASVDIPQYLRAIAAAIRNLSE